MSNPLFNTDENKRRQTPVKHIEKKGKTGQSPFPEKTANWPGLPGKTQGKSRNAGVPRAKIHPSSKGL